ncbi:hypothetical protein SARC_04432 [Sphaeroforma arctica JP610]|uniref:Uncharacterized protein n=1 Tax=Sphaeroforma arctica JP610 TaxID=667725 RepID=A0A0L0G2E5_9EUKA|nr:hypothetical protein SARC_04432 [Sphaeroforma arctica JP610]KNC83307.1 hypothetical protein SARC_04432 [Sphaeroforma arctica JP610]|eukprot:XP_014157209.1 hypothetical protein SARC_04432 [Sphaeroforma arctica JP610]
MQSFPTNTAFSLLHSRTLAGTLRPREHLRVAGSNTAVHMRAQSHSPVRSGNRTTPVLRSPTRASSCEMSLETQQPNQAEGGLTGHPVGSSDAGRNSYDRLCKTGLDLSDRLGERSDESDMLSDRSVRTGNRAEVDADYSVRPRVSVKAEPQCKTNRHPEDLLDNMDTGEMDIRRTTGLNVTYDEPRVGSAAQCVRQTGIGMRQSEGSIRHLMDDIRQPEGTAKVPVIAMTEPTEVTGAIVNCNRGYKRAISGAPITPGVGSDDGDVCMGIKEESTVKSISSTHRKRRRVTFAKSVVFKSQREYTEPGDETDHISRAEQYKDTAKALSERLQTSGRHLLALRLALHLSSVSEEYFVSGTLFTTGTTHATSHHSHRSPPARTSGSFRPARGSHTAHRSTFTPDVFVVECVRMSTGEVVGMVLRERVLDLGMCVAYGLAHTDAFNTNFRTLIK